jgi:hypothetical protein
VTSAEYATRGGLAGTAKPFTWRALVIRNLPRISDPADTNRIATSEFID